MSFTRNFLLLFLQPLLHYWARKAEPQKQGTLLIAGLKDEVKVRWGPYAVPHIFAANEHDLFMAQGYIHAQERLWQMDFNRRFLSGRLAETLGTHSVPWKELSVRFRDHTTVDLDHFIRLMGTRRAACGALKLLPQEFVDRLSAYSEGVNRYIESHLKSLPLEFRLLRYQPEPWRAEDSLTIGKGFALFLSTSLFTRLTLAAITDKLRDQTAKLKSLFPGYPASEPCITRFVSDGSRQLLRFLTGTFEQSGWAASGQGSNNWVVAGSRSSTGRPILCNDPHLRLTLPSVWYLMHLKAARAGSEEAESEVWGASIPGSPCIHLGHNRWISWGVTAALCDDMDLFAEKLHPQRPDCYWADNDWQSMACEEETIRIRGGKAVKKTIRFTRHGPVISDFFHKGAEKEALSLQWTAHMPSEEFRALYGVNQARNWDEFLASLSYQAAPTLNYVYADATGNIGYSLAGRIPIRPKPHSFLPLPGWSGEWEWKGYVPFSELPRIYNPPGGLIATANNRIVDASYPHYLSDLFEPPYRILRIKELLGAKGTHSPDEMAAIQRDVVSVQAIRMIRDLRSDLEESAKKTPSLKKAVERLVQWNGDCAENSVEAALFHLLHQRLMRNLLAADLGEDLFLSYTEIFNQALLPVEQIMRDPRSPWFDSSPRHAVVERSLREACEELAQRLGADMEKWSWGRLHTLTLEHPLGRNKILARIFSLGPFPSGGDAATINMGFYRHSNPYAHTVGPSLRMVIDVGNWRGSKFILPSGQSGHLFSPHYGDQNDLWRRAEYIPLAHDAGATSTWPILTLTPRS